LCDDADSGIEEVGHREVVESDQRDRVQLSVDVAIVDWNAERPLGVT